MKGRAAYHGFDIWMRDRVEFVVTELELRANVDIGAFIFGAVAVLGCRKDWAKEIRFRKICPEAGRCVNSYL